MLAIIVSTLLFATTTIAVLGRLRRQRRHDLRFMEVRAALDACSLLLRLLRQLQQHRGMSSALLSGDRSYEARLAAKRAEIHADIGTLNAAALRESERPHPCFTRNDLSLFRFKWATLADNLTALTPEQSIAQHTQLISQALDWLANYGEARIELPAGQDVSVGVARNFSHRLPTLAETLGQARALGMGAAASGACRPVTRVRLMFLVARGESLLQQAATLDAAGAAGETARLAVLDMIRIIRCEILGATVAIAADTYYRLATAAIDAVYAWIDECVDELGAQLRAAKAPPFIELAYRREPLREGASS